MQVWIATWIDKHGDLHDQEVLDKEPTDGFYDTKGLPELEGMTLFVREGNVNGGDTVLVRQVTY